MIVTEVLLETNNLDLKATVQGSNGTTEKSVLMLINSERCSIEWPGSPPGLSVFANSNGP